MNTAILAEKPDQMRKIKQAYESGSYPNLGTVEFVNARGHLYELVEPEAYDDKWSRKNGDNWKTPEEILSSLPIFPESFKKRQKKGVSGLLKDINAAFTKADQIIVATDPDTEGAGIAWSIIDRVPGARDKKILQLEYKAQTIPDFQEALKHPSDGMKYRPMAEQSQAREEADWLVGMNVSRLTTALLQKQGYRAQFPVGRVQTPTVKKIVDREREIQNFIPTENLRVVLVDEDNDVTFTGIEGVGEFRPSNGGSVAANEFLNTLYGGWTTIISVEKEQKHEAAPALFKFSKLQAEASRLFKWAPKKTAELYQWLYEGGWVSYPRTDEQKIAPSEFDYLLENLTQYLALIDETDMPIAYTEPRTKYVSTGNLDHSANIPSQQLPTADVLNGWDEDYQNLYKLIVKRTMLMFSPDMVFDSTSVIVENSGFQFKATGNVIVDRGWRGYWFGEKKDRTLPNYQQGQEVDLVPTMKDIAPPKRYTEADMTDHVMDAMGIGRPSTQPAILEKITQTYINRDPKRGELSPKDSAFVLVDFLDSTVLTKPEMTAKWEEYLDDIGAGHVKNRTLDGFIKITHGFIDKTMTELPGEVAKLDSIAVDDFGKRDNQAIKIDTVYGRYDLLVIEGQNAKGKYKFLSIKDGEEKIGTVFAKQYGKSLTNKQLLKLVTEGQLKKVKLKSKNDRDYTANMVLNNDWSVSLSFD